MLPGFPRANFWKMHTIKGKKQQPFRARSACSVGLGQAGCWQAGGRKLGAGQPVRGGDGSRDGVGTMPIVETEVEKPAAQGAAMEITVSRQELVKELTATQSVVERKTTIPILSNFLIEAEGDRLNITATDLDQAIRTSAAGQGEEAGLVHHSRPQALRLHQAAARWRHLDQAAGEPLGADSLRPLEHQDGGHGARELSAGAGVPGRVRRPAFRWPR